MKEIKADSVPRLVLLNKCDKAAGVEGADEVFASELHNAFPDAIRVSAKTQEGFEQLLAAITEALYGKVESYRIPMADCALVELVRKNGKILKEEWSADYIDLEARISGTIDSDGKASTRTKALLSAYIVHGGRQKNE